MSRKFKWQMWDYDCDGTAYIISKSECPNKNDVPKYIVKEDCLSDDCLSPQYGEGKYLSVNDVKEGWCKYMVRSDWYDVDEPTGGYYVTEFESETKHSITGKRKSGWFPVWIVRIGEWY